MGSWGSGLYQDDTALDVREAFKELVILPVEPAELVERMATRFGMGAAPMDEEEVDFWLALADQLHLYAIEHAPTMDRAREIITSGADLAAKEALEMAPRDLAKRKVVLGQLLDRWAVPHPKPRKRKMMKGPEPFVFDIGDVWVYPTMNHAAIPVQWGDYHPATIGDFFRRDGWGAMIVFDRWLHQDFHARYLIAVAWLEKGAEPTLEAVRAAPVDGWFERDWLMEDQVAFVDLHSEMAFSTHFPKARKRLKALEAVRIGALPVDAATLRAKARVIVEQAFDRADGLASLPHLLTLRSTHDESPEMVSIRGEPCRHLPVASVLSA
ncbi:MAG: hypothetical protein AAF160_12695 [Pseudomonadota bacterium]